MANIAIFYHGLFFTMRPDCPPVSAANVVGEQMDRLKGSGLEAAAAEIHIGINGGEESDWLACVLFPRRAKFYFHGLQCKNENRTILTLEKWLPDHRDWYVLYFHAKGATKVPNSSEAEYNATWRECMMRNVVDNWQRCIQDLDAGFESVGCHWMTHPQTPPGQSIWAGTFFWAKASFLATLPSIVDTARVKLSGIDSPDSRYEAEVWIGNGPRLPRIKDYHPGWDPSKIATCRL